MLLSFQKKTMTNSSLSSAITERVEIQDEAAKEVTEYRKYFLQREFFKFMLKRNYV